MTLCKLTDIPHLTFLLICKNFGYIIPKLSVQVLSDLVHDSVKSLKIGLNDHFQHLTICLCAVFKYEVENISKSLHSAFISSLHGFLTLFGIGVISAVSLCREFRGKTLSLCISLARKWPNLKQHEL